MVYHEKISWASLVASLAVWLPYFFYVASLFVRRTYTAPTMIRNSIRSLRFDADEMTQQHLAERAGVTRQTIIAIEAGKYAPSLELAFRIAAAFGKPLEEVFQYDPSTN